MTPIELKTISGVSPAGVPDLSGENRRVIAVQVFGPEHIGQLCACQPVASEEDAMLALGVVDAGEDTANGDRPVVIRAGKARLILAPDGSIVMEGTSFGLRARDRVTINGAVVELNG